MPTLTEELRDTRGQVEERRAKLALIFEEAGPDLDFEKVKSLDGDTTAKIAGHKAINDELTELMKKLEPLEAQFRELDDSRKRVDELGRSQPHPGHPIPGGGSKTGGQGVDTKTFGEIVVESDLFRDGQPVKDHTVELDYWPGGLKTLMDTATGFVPETTRTGRVVDYATRPLQVIDLIPSNTTSQAAVVYMEETTYTNNAAETAEAGTYPEAALAYTEKSSPVRKIAVWLPVTDEQLEDVPYIRGRINTRLPFMAMQRLDTQTLVGNGTAPNLRGILNVSGIQTQAKGADPGPDAIHKAMTLCRVVGRAVPGAVVFHPTNWQDIRLLRTTDGIYIWGSPSEAGPARIWGNAVALADGLTLGHAIVGDWLNYSELVQRRGIEVKISDSHGTFFVEGKQAIRADMRYAVVWYRPAAFVDVTGL